MSGEFATAVPPTLPVGTQIVTRVVTRVEVLGAAGETICPRGAVGAVVAAPDGEGGTYRVRFPNGSRRRSGGGSSPSASRFRGKYGCRLGS